MPDTPAHSEVAWRVEHVAVEPDYRLRVRFADGVEGVVDVKALIFAPGAGVFAALADEELFAKAHLEYGAVTWPGEIDLAPDAMRANVMPTIGAATSAPHQ